MRKKQIPLGFLQEFELQQGDNCTAPILLLLLYGDSGSSQVHVTYGFFTAEVFLYFHQKV